MLIQLLISTVDKGIERNELLLKETGSLIVNQISDVSYKLNKNLLSRYSEVLNLQEKGLSKSRNCALKASSGDICLIADDDVRFVPSVKDIVKKAFNELPKADVITFMIMDENGMPLKRYRNHSFKHNFLSVMKVSSIEIAFRRDPVVRKKILFDENFGLGTRYPSGEENIFLIDMMKSGLSLYFYPAVIVIHPHERSSLRINNDLIVVGKGAMFARMFGFFAFFVNIAFALKQRKNYLGKMKVLKYIYLLSRGTVMFLKGTVEK